MTLDYQDFQLENHAIAGLGALLRAGEISSRGLVAFCFRRMDVIDPLVNAVLERNPEAGEIAAALDRELASGNDRGPLHGLPILLKDNIDSGDQMVTSAGSLALADNFAAKDATLVARLRQAGAVILGKSNLSEWANFRSARSSSGWSSRGGQTRNAYALDRTPGGSSSGSAVAVSAGLCVAAIGTETDGSIVSPSAMASIVGLKSTVGLIPRTGIIPIAASQDNAGPMARSVADAAALLNVLAGSDAADPASATAEQHRETDYSDFLDPQGLAGARLGAVTALADFHHGAAAIFAGNLLQLRNAGATVIDDIEVPAVSAIRPAEMVVMESEFKAGLNAYLAARGPNAPIRSLAEVIAFNQAHSAEVMPYFPQDLLQRAEARGPLGDQAYRRARAECLRLARDEGIDRALAADDLDALVICTTSAPWLIDWVAGDNRSGGSAYLAAIAGYPAITVPAGYLNGLPIGLSFVAGAWQEGKLLRLAHAFEQATQHRRPPEFPATVAFDI